MTTKMSDLPWDLTEEVLSKLPVTSMRTIQSICKKWNTLSKDHSFIKKHFAQSKASAAKKKHLSEFEVMMMLEFKVYLMTINLLNPSIDRIGKLISLDYSNRVDISQIFHCDGLFLCITNEYIFRLVVWNPYLGQTRWIKPRNSYHSLDRYAFGYDIKNNLRGDHKILRFVDCYMGLNRRICEFEIYNLNSNSWKVIDVTPDWDIELYQRGVSLNGNTYWFATQKIRPRHVPGMRDFLLSFDFTTERFGPRLLVPFQYRIRDTVTLSSVREEQLALLFQCRDSFNMKIWISSNKIDPYAVSWSMFLSVDMKPLTGFQFQYNGASFLVDEKKKLVVVLDKDKDIYCPTRNIAYIIGKNGYYEEVDLGGSTNADCCPLVCSYVPSLVQIKRAAP